jgi:hypothetical protein
VIDLDPDLVLAPLAGRGAGHAVRGGGEPTAGCAHLGRRPRAVLDVDSHHEAELEAQENVLVSDECLRPLGGAIATEQLTRELSALDPVALPRSARRGGDPGPFDVHLPSRCGGRTILIAARCPRALHPTTSDRADPETELPLAVGDGR